MEIHQKPNTPPESKEVEEMLRYARNIIEEFRRAKHYKYILTSHFLSWNNLWDVRLCTHACHSAVTAAVRLLKNKKRIIVANVVYTKIKMLHRFDPHYLIT